MKDQASYICDSCGEEIVVPIDLSAGATQEYVEDCPVVCRPNVIHIEVDEDDDVRVWAAMAWRCLVTMKDYALPYLKSRHRSATGEERERIAKLIDRLENAPVEEEVPPATRPWLLIVLAVSLVFGVAGSFVLAGAGAFVVTVLMTVLT